MKSNLLARLRSFTAALSRRRHFEAGMDDEMRFHLAAQIDDLVRAGVPLEDARRRARLAFGTMDGAKEDCRQARGLQALDELGQDLGYGVRSMMRSPGFAAAAIGSLALGIGANAGVFSVLKAAVADSLMFRDPDRLVMIWSTPPLQSETIQTMAVPEYIALGEHTGTFERVGAMLSWTANLGASENGAPADRLAGQRFTTSIFEVLGVAPERGRIFSEAETFLGAPETAIVISHDLWQKRFGGDPDILSKSMLVDGTPLHIVGVMPSGYGFLDSKPEFWIQMNFSPFQARSALRPGVMTVVGRLAPGMSIEQAQQRMDAFAAEREKLLPQANRGRGIRLQPLDSAYFGGVRTPLIVLQAAVAVVLLIACANVAGLLLIRATARQREVAIRSALGGGRRRLVRQFLTESLMLSLIGGTAGIVLAWAIVRALVSTGPTWLARVSHISVDGQVLAFSAIVSIVTGLAFGTAPALQLSRFAPAGSLADSGRSTTGGRQRRRLQRALVAAQLALTLVLLVGAGLVLRSFLKLQSAEIGFEPKGLLSFQSRLPANQFFKQVGLINGSPRLEMSPVPPLLFDRVFQRLQQVPGIQSAAGINFPPLSGVTMPVTFSIESQPETTREGSDSNMPSAAYFLVTPNLFKTMQTPVLRGRDIAGTDTDASPWVAVVNDTLARRYWPAGNALGQRIRLNIVPEEQLREIVGIVGDTQIGRMDHGASPIIYAPQLQQPLMYRVPYGQSRVMMSYVVRLTQPVDTVMPLLRQAVSEVDARLPVADTQMVETYLGRQIEAPRSYMLFLVTFGAVATLLAAVGIYGVVAYSVAQRSKELAVRMALGANPGAIVRLVAAEAAWLIAIGSVAGVGGALALTRWISAVLWEVTATDPASFAAALLLLSLVTMCATLVPAARVFRLDPRSVLVHE